jgi:hypothetical protein
VRDGFLQGSRALPGTGTYLRLSGKNSARLHATGNDLTAAKKAFSVGDEVPADAARQEGNLL